MKRFLATILAAVMMLSSSIVFAQQTSSITATSITNSPVHKVLSTTGEIKEISSGRVQVAGKGSFDEVIVNIQPHTHIVSGIDGTPVPFNELKKGDAITVYYGPRATRSLPPQSNAIALVVGKPDKGSAGMYLQVAELYKNNDGSVKVLCTNGDRLVTIPPEAFVATYAIKQGSELIVWYNMITMSLPGQATALKAVLLPVKADIRVNTLAGVIVVNGKELVLNENDTIKKSGDTVMLPLCTIAESLGYEVIWHQDSRTVELKNGSNTMMVTIGSKIYGKLKMAVQLDNAPEIVNGKTLVPVEFFTNVMGLTVDINNDHV